VQRLIRVDGGYRFWLDTCREPFWIPEARFVLWPLRVGLSVQFGGYWNGAGYYGVESYGPAAVPYPAAALLAGIVAGYDYDSGTLTVRDDRSGAYVSVVLRGDDLDPAILRPGDWISLSGNWNRGYFEEYRVEDLRAR